MTDEADTGVSNEAPETGFEIDGERYAVPTLDTVTIDEERILYIYADCVVQDFVPSHPSWDDRTRAAHDLIQAQKIRNPDFKRALAHIAYRRRNPDTADAEIQKAIGTVGALELDIAMVSGEDDASPPDLSSQNEPPKQSGTSEPTSSTGSGSPTANGSAEADANPNGTGAFASDTSFQVSPAKT